jgi:N-acetylglucosamine-6-phosphate deacetylase
VYGFEGDTPEAQRKLSEENLHSVKIITCAPELDGVMESIPDLVKAGITVSVGRYKYEDCSSSLHPMCSLPNAT